MTDAERALLEHVLRADPKEERNREKLRGAVLLERATPELFERCVGLQMTYSRGIKANAAMWEALDGAGFDRRGDSVKEMLERINAEAERRPADDPYAVTLSARDEAPRYLTKLAAAFENMSEPMRVTALAFLRERYADSGRRR